MRNHKMRKKNVICSYLYESTKIYSSIKHHHQKIQNWKIGKRMDTKLANGLFCAFLVFFFPFSFELRFCMKILLFRCVLVGWQTTPNQKTIFARIKKNHFKRFWLAENWKNYSERLFWTIPSAVHAFLCIVTKDWTYFQYFFTDALGQFKNIYVYARSISKVEEKKTRGDGEIVSTILKKETEKKDTHREMIFELKIILAAG